jgi:DNA repair photolyase
MEPQHPSGPRRGAAENPPNRFERLATVADPSHRDDDPDETLPADPRTVFLRDASRSILARNQSPDIPFAASINPYRGCEHGCAYCYARPSHEYLGLSAGLDFETRILVKEDAPELLRRELAARSWEPQVVALSGVTDCYQPVERRLRITRRCLEVLAEYRNPVTVVTKSALVSRDADVLATLARFEAAAVAISVTTLDVQLQRALEPRAPRPSSRLKAIEILAKAGVPVGVMVAPVIPGLTDHEMPRILEAAAAAGARFAGLVVLRLPFGVADLFEAWLDRHAPLRKQKILSRIHALRGGRRNDPRFGSRLRGEGIYADEISRLFALGCKQAGIPGRGPTLSTAHFLRPGGAQLPLL